MAIVQPIVDQAGWEQWLSTRPDVIKQLVARLPPDRLYLLKTSNHRVTIYSYNEDGTVSVVVSGKYNRVLFERNVFGIKPEDLEECDLPPADEETGAGLHGEEVDQYIEAHKAGRNKKYLDSVVAKRRGLNN